MGDETPIDWLPRDRRYGEKLATPDTTIADLIGEVDPIKVAEGRYLSDELTIHYGMVPRTNRGIFCINELPDLAERIQVGLLNIMEERDVQIRGYKVRLDLDMYIVVSANPEDYTNRGRIITPLKDRFGSEIRTHYPKTIEHEMDIMERERNYFEDDGIAVDTPQYMKEIVAELTHLARKSPQISQKSGVSVRVSIANYENLVSSALRRAIILDEDTAVPRISDLPAVVASTAGKIELESMGEMDEQRVVERLVQQATATTFERHFRLSELEGVIRSFEKGMSLDVSDGMPARDYLRHMQSLGGMDAAVAKLDVPDEPGARRLRRRVHPRRPAPQPPPQQEPGRRAVSLPGLTRSTENRVLSTESGRLPLSTQYSVLSTEGNPAWFFATATGTAHRTSIRSMPTISWRRSPTT